jgi:hypothetical protein
MRRAILAGLLLVLVGCGKDDPASSRLAAGTDCIVIERPTLPTLYVGSRVKVESDAGDSMVSEGTELRGVDCVVLDGAAAGQTKSFARCILRPL